MAVFHQPLRAEVHDLTGVELAAALGVSHIAVRALLTRARESLRQALAAEQAVEDAFDAEAIRRAGSGPTHPGDPLDRTGQPGTRP